MSHNFEKLVSNEKVIYRDLLRKKSVYDVINESDYRIPTSIKSTKSQSTNLTIFSIFISSLQTAQWCNRRQLFEKLKLHNNDQLNQLFNLTLTLTLTELERRRQYMENEKLIMLVDLLIKVLQKWEFYNLITNDHVTNL